MQIIDQDSSIVDSLYKRGIVIDRKDAHILRYLSEKPRTASDVATELNVSYQTAFRYLRALHKRNLLVKSDVRYSEGYTYQVPWKFLNEQVKTGNIPVVLLDFDHREWTFEEFMAFLFDGGEVKSYLQLVSMCIGHLWWKSFKLTAAEDSNTPTTVETKALYINLVKYFKRLTETLEKVVVLPIWNNDEVVHKMMGPFIPAAAEQFSNGLFNLFIQDEIDVTGIVKKETFQFNKEERMKDFKARFKEKS